jgi:excisionase family DNA binding protein
MIALAEQIEPVAPGAEEIDLAKESSRVLSPFRHKNLKIQIPRRGKPAEITLPASAVELLVSLLTEMASGNAITLIPIHAELTTQQAAELLNVSRPYLIKLLQDGELPFKKVGTHRRIRFSDLMVYKKKTDAKSESALSRLVADAQDQDMGY